ncbi:MAG: DUF2070 family protein [Promethearchaeota archaeon]
MFSQKQPTRQAPGIFSYMEFFSSKILAYSLFFCLPILIGVLSMTFNAILMGSWDFIFFFKICGIFMTTSILGASISIIFYSKRAPILRAPPNGWAIQMNAFFTVIIGAPYFFGQILAIFLRNIYFQEVFFMLGTIISYIFAFVIYFSFTTVGRPGYLILALVQPVIGIILYSMYTAQVSLLFFIRAILFFCTCAFIFAIPYARNLFQVSNIYKDATGIGGYRFIRAFVLSMMTDRNDDRIEEIFDRVGVESNIKIQYLIIRSKKKKNIKGLFVIPHAHFGPFKTCGSADLPEQIYEALGLIPGTTVYHTTNDHSQNLTTQEEVNKVVDQIKSDINKINNDPDLQWIQEIGDSSRKISNSAKLIGIVVNNVPIVFVTRHPLPSDDIEEKIGNKIREMAKNEGFKEIISIDSHNSIIGDEILIKKDSLEANDIINVVKKYLINNKEGNFQKDKLLYGVAKDPFNEFSEKDGIGKGGMVVHLFKNTRTDQKTAFIHFDANNAYVDIRSYILNLLQNQGIERGEITTSDSHTVARQFTSRGYSPIGDKIKIDIILTKVETLIKKAEKDLEPVEFHYSDSIVEGVKIWGERKYFHVIMETLEECIRVSQRLLTLSLIIPTFFSLILLLFYYDISIF